MSEPASRKVQIEVYSLRAEERRSVNVALARSSAKNSKRPVASIRCSSLRAAAGSSLGKVVKCNVYLRDINDFQAMNEVYGTYFQPPFPARTTIQAGALPAGIAVEIEVVART